MFQDLVVRLRRWRDYSDTVSALSRLSEAELDDLGIERGDIPKIARRAVR